MARPVVYHWKPADPDAICKAQASPGGNLVINGHEASQGSVIFPGVLRTVSITKGAVDLDDIEFTITGTYGNKIVSQKINGPPQNGNARVYTSQLFSSVTSVSASKFVASVRVGSGISGKTNWFLHNYHSTSSPAFTVSVVLNNVDANLEYTFSTTLDDIDEQVQYMPNTIEEGDFFPKPALFPVIDSMVANNDSDMGSYNGATRYSTVEIVKADSADLTITFLQQGIT